MGRPARTRCSTRQAGGHRSPLGLRGWLPLPTPTMPRSAGRKLPRSSPMRCAAKPSEKRWSRPMCGERASAALLAAAERQRCTGSWQLSGSMRPSPVRLRRSLSRAHERLTLRCIGGSRSSGRLFHQVPVLRQSSGTDESGPATAHPRSRAVRATADDRGSRRPGNRSRSGRLHRGLGMGRLGLVAPPLPGLPVLHAGGRPPTRRH